MDILIIIVIGLFFGWPIAVIAAAAYLAFVTLVHFIDIYT
jgi:hypothetical protein